MTPSTIAITRHTITLPRSTADAHVFLCSDYHSGPAASDTASRQEVSLVNASDDGPKSYESLIDRIPTNADIAVLFEHNDAATAHQHLKNKAAKDGQLIIAPVGYRQDGDLWCNSVAVAKPDGDVVLLDK